MMEVKFDISKKDILNCQKFGLSDRKIAKIFGCSSVTIIMKRRKFGIKSLSTIFLISGERNSMWKNNVGFSGIHSYILRHKSKLDECESCHRRCRLDLAFKDDKAGSKNKVYTRNVNDYHWLCRKCHMKRDGRLDKLHGGNYLWNANMKILN